MNKNPRYLFWSRYLRVYLYGSNGIVDISVGRPGKVWLSVCVWQVEEDEE